MVRSACADMVATAGPQRTGSTWQEGVTSIFRLVPGFSEAAGAGKAVQMAAMSVAVLALVGVGILIVNARKK